VTLHVAKGGAKLGALVTKLDAVQGEEELVDDVSLDGATLAQAERSESRLLYATPELSAPLHLSGAPRLTIKLSSNRAAANLSVWLVTLPWTDSKKPGANVVTRGWADPQNSASLTSSKPLARGKPYDLSFELQPDDQIIPAGKRLALMIFSSDRDFTLWPSAGTKLTIDLDATRLELPIVGGAAAFESAFAAAKR
jgi:X-Pro dipeptidyl-peptidase